jgi:hypothetical protein
MEKIMCPEVEMVCKDRTLGLKLAYEISHNKAIVARLHQTWGSNLCPSPAEYLTRLGYIQAMDELYGIDEFEELHKKSVHDPEAMNAVLRLMDTALANIVYRTAAWKETAKTLC